MAHVNDFLCDDCGSWCSANDVPLVVYVVAGKPPDCTAEVDLNAPGVKVPEFIRDLMRQPVQRKEFCVGCFAKAFGLESVEAQRPPVSAPVEAH